MLVKVSLHRLSIFTSAVVLFAVTVGFAVANCQALGLLEQSREPAAAHAHDGHDHEHHSEGGPAVHCPNPFEHFVLSRSFAPSYQQHEYFFAPVARVVAGGEFHPLCPSGRGPPGVLADSIPSYLFLSVLRI